MTDKTREAFEAIVGETDLDLYIDETEEYYSGRTLRAFGKYCEDIVAATAAAEANYLPLAEAWLRYKQDMRPETRNDYLRASSRVFDCALAKPLLEKKET